MQSNDPTKLRIFFGISSLFPSFLRWRSVGEGKFLICYESKNVRSNKGEKRVESPWIGCKLLVVSSLCLVLKQKIICLGLHWTLLLTPYTLHLTFSYFEAEGSGVKIVQRNSIYNINIIYTISLTRRTHFQKRKV